MSDDFSRARTEQVREAVRKWYSGGSRSRAADAHYPTGRAGAEALGYERAAIEAAPAVLLNGFCGVGNPPALSPTCTAGETVLDVGCGSGFDLFVAARLVGPSGQALGIDLTPQMAARAAHGLAQAGLGWASAEVGSAEEIPGDAASVDVVLSNGALNLLPDKEKALREIHRVLRPGGRLHFADIVRSGQVSRESAGDPDAWSQ